MIQVALARPITKGGAVMDAVVRDRKFVTVFFALAWASGRKSQVPGMVSAESRPHQNPSASRVFVPWRSATVGWPQAHDHSSAGSARI